MKRRNIFTVALISTVLVCTLVAIGYYWTIQKDNEVKYWILKISPSDSILSAGSVTPNGTVYVPLNQAGINVTAVATGINGFMGWVLDGKTLNNSNSTIFVPKQQANSIHTLEAQFVYGTPVPLFSYNISTSNLGVVNIAGYTGAFDNISQGVLLQVNLTFTSITDQQIVIPLENLTVTYYNTLVNRHNFISTSDNYSIIQEAFNYSFSLNPIPLQPLRSNSTLLTINVANDAPLGQYTLDIRTGKIEANSESYFDTIEFEMIITSKAT